MVPWKSRQRQETQRDTQAQRIRNEDHSAGDLSGDHAEPFPFVALSLDEEASIPMDNEHPPTQPTSNWMRQSFRRQGLQEDFAGGEGETNSLPISISPQSLLVDLPPSDISSSAASNHAAFNPTCKNSDFKRASLNPQYLRHGISQDNQYIRHGLQRTLATNYQPSQAIAIFSKDGQRKLAAGYSDVKLLPEWIRRQREEESRLRHESVPFLLETEVDQQKEWLEVEFHPRLQSALLDRHHQHRDEELLIEYTQYVKSGKCLSPRIQEFLLEQAKALEILKTRPSSIHRGEYSSEASLQVSQDQSSVSTDRRLSSSSISMRIWMDGHNLTPAESNRRQLHASNEGNQTTVSDLLLLPPHKQETSGGGQSEKDDGDDMDSRFSDVDYMTDYQWSALRKAIVRSNSSLVGKWKKALNASSDLPSQPVPPKRTMHIQTAQQQLRTAGDARTSNYDSGDDELDPLVRTPSPQPRQGSADKQPGPLPNETVAVLPKGPQEQIQSAMNEAIANIQTRVCPNCQQNILEKEENGNNKITCSMCGAISCYICRKIVPAAALNHFGTDSTRSDSSGKCPLWTDTQTDLEHDKKLAIDMLMEITNQVLRDTFHSKR